MLRFIVRRIALAFVQIILVMTLVFLLLRIMPGDPAVLALGTDHVMDVEAVESMRSQLGLDKPIWEQYVSWMGDAFKLDLGSSTRDGTSVIREIGLRFPRTLELVVCAVVLASILGVSLGVISALKRNSALDRILTSISAGARSAQNPISQHQQCAAPGCRYMFRPRAGTLHQPWYLLWGGSA